MWFFLSLLCLWFISLLLCLERRDFFCDFLFIRILLVWNINVYNCTLNYLLSVKVSANQVHPFCHLLENSAKYFRGKIFHLTKFLLDFFRLQNLFFMWRMCALGNFPATKFFTWSSFSVEKFFTWQNFHLEKFFRFKIFSVDNFHVG